MLVAGFVYIALAVGLLALWAAGFNPYCGYGFLLGRPLLLWGAAAYACMALACFGGVRKQYALAGAAALAAVHASFLALAWRDSGYLCPACAVFLVIEATLAGLLVFAPVKKRYLVLLSLAGAFLFVSVTLLAYNPSVFGHVLANAGVPEGDPAGADNKPVVAEGVSAPGGHVAGKLPAVQSRPDGQAVARIREASPEVAPAPPAAAGGPKEVPLAPEKPWVAVMTVEGQEVQLDISRRPVLYFTWWCPACREVLQEIAGFPPEERPYLVAVCLAGVDVSRSFQELADLGMRDAELYISRKGPGNVLPALVLVEEGQARTVAGRLAVLQEVMGRAGKL